ncbi:hypothetical protein ACJQWK_07729 [Exserohilum turcicum]
MLVAAAACLSPFVLADFKPASLQFPAYPPRLQLRNPRNNFAVGRRQHACMFLSRAKKLSNPPPSPLAPPPRAKPPKVLGFGISPFIACLCLTDMFFSFFGVFVSPSLSLPAFPPSHVPPSFRFFLGGTSY